MIKYLKELYNRVFKKKEQKFSDTGIYTLVDRNGKPISGQSDPLNIVMLEIPNDNVPKVISKTKKKRKTRKKTKKSK